jgi:hypothetical protein
MLTTSNFSNFNSSIKFDKHQTFYQEIYHQIDLIRKFKVTSELTTKEKVISARFIFNFFLIYNKNLLKSTTRKSNLANAKI